MPDIRTFIAIELPKPIQLTLGNVIQNLKASAGGVVRWVEAKNIHLTLKFLGDISPQQVEALKPVLQAEVERFAAFDLLVHGVGAFPNLQRPRVVWVGLQAPPVLAELQQSIEGAALRLGHPAEERPFSPHLTLGRVRPEATREQAQQLGLALSRQSVAEMSAPVETVVLFRSDLRPGGSVYTPLFSFGLSKKSDPK